MALAEQIVGTWTLVSSVDIHADGSTTETWGSAPLGHYMFDANGRFTQIVMRSDLPVFASRDSVTPEQAKAVVAGSLAMFGTYAVDEAAGIVNVQFEACTFPAFTGTAGTRVVAMTSPDEMVFTNAGRAGGANGRSVWRRVG
jgi:Lipocalin-like domain